MKLKIGPLPNPEKVKILVQISVELKESLIVPRGVVYESWILARSTRAQLTTADNRAG
jgi:hypothetical protein